jgi:hypothetical protein
MDRGVLSSGLLSSGRERRRVLLEQAAMISRACGRSVPEAADRAGIQRHYEAVLTVEARLAASAGEQSA